MPVGAWSYDDLGALVASGCRSTSHACGAGSSDRRRDSAARARRCRGAHRLRERTRRARRGRGGHACRDTRTASGRGRAVDAARWAPLTFPVMSAPSCGARREWASVAPSTASRSTSTGCAHTRASSLEDAAAESAAMWSGLARVAADEPVHVDPLRRRRARRRGRRARPTAWCRIPYPKALTANPFVNQGAALLVTDADTARALGSGRGTMGVPPRWCRRRRTRPTRAHVAAYHRVPALEATIRDVQDVTGVAVADADHAELYSCFPAMPKLTRRAIGPARRPRPSR